MRDVVVVGAGPAGLAAAYFLRDTGLEVTVLEAAPEVGGRTKSVEVGGAPSNTGALFVYRHTASEELAAELGIATTPFTPQTYGIHINGTTVVDSDLDQLVARLPVRDDARRALSRVFADSLREYEHYTAGGGFGTGADELAEQTMAQRMEGLPPEAAVIITAAVRGGSVADPSEISAQYALRYFASYLAFEQHNRLYPTTGMQSIPGAMSELLDAGTVRLHSRVTGIRYEPASDTFVIDIENAPPERSRHVVLTVPAPLVPRLVTDLPAWKLTALAAARMPGSTTLCVTADVDGLPDLHRWSFVATPGRRFDVIINPSPTSGAGAGSRRVIQFVCYATTTGYRPDLDDDPGTLDPWVDDFLTVVPQLRGRVLGAHLQSWEHCFAIVTPERLRALPALQRSVGKLHFAGDHTSPSAGTHGAYAEGRRVAGLIRAQVAAG